MNTENSPRLGLDFVMAAQAQKHVTVNETFRRLDALVQASAISTAISAQPASPGEGDTYILGESPSGDDWSLMQPGSLATYRDGEWAEIIPSTGWRAWQEDEAQLLVYDGNWWTPVSSLVRELQNLVLLGVGTQADMANPFAAKLNAALWTALSSGEGGSGDLRYTLNKEGDGNILSFLFQSDYSGRAEIGLVGNNDLTVKLSNDGTSWQEVLRANPERVDIGANQGVWLKSLNGQALAASRNLLINGDFAIAQRGSHFVAPLTGSYFLDRWKFVSGGGMSCELSREDFEAGQNGIPGQPGHFLQWRLTGTATGNPWIEQRIEGAGRLGEGAAALSLYARASRSMPLVVRVRRHFGTGGSSTEVLAQKTLSLTPQWQPFVVDANVPDLTGKNFGAGHHLSVEFFLLGGETDADISLADIQLEPGNIPTQFERVPLADAIRQCQRYFAKTYLAEAAPGEITTDGQLTASTSGPAQTAIFDWRLPVEMYSSQSVTVYSPASGNAGVIDASGTELAASVITASPTAITIQSASHASLALAHGHIAAEAEL